MEGAQSKGDERILLIGATNRPQELDDVMLIIIFYQMCFLLCFNNNNRQCAEDS